MRVGRDGLHVVKTSVVDDLAGTPVATAIAVLLNLEPSTANAGVGEGVADFLKICEGWALMACVHHVAGTGGEGMSPYSLHGGASLDGDNLLGGSGRVGTTIAGYIV